MEYVTLNNKLECGIYTTSSDTKDWTMNTGISGRTLTRIQVRTCRFRHLSYE